MTNNYPKLTEMGIVNPDQIDRFSLQPSGDKDILRVVYKREKGSLLPGSKKFKFQRMARMVSRDGKNENVSEVSPHLSKVLLELQELVTTKHTHAEQLAIIKDEMNRMEEELSTRMSHLTSLISKLED